MLREFTSLLRIDLGPPRGLRGKLWLLVPNVVLVASIAGCNSGGGLSTSSMSSAQSSVVLKGGPPQSFELHSSGRYFAEETVHNLGGTTQPQFCKGHISVFPEGGAQDDYRALGDVTFRANDQGSAQTAEDTVVLAAGQWWARLDLSCSARLSWMLTLSKA